MNLKSIEHNPASSTIVDPWKKAATKRYHDEMLKPESEDRVLRLKEGPNWMRIVPANVSKSSHWLLAMHGLGTPEGRFAHPRTIDPANRSVWDNVYGYLHKTAPKKLFSNLNRDGLRLLPNPFSLCWVIIREGTADDSPAVARLLMLSGYSGERGGPQGLGYQLLSLAHERDENGDLAHDILGENGVQICIQKVVGKESKYPRFILRAGRQPAPISELLARLPESELAALEPLESLVRCMSEDEQWERLERLMPAAEVAAIRKAIERK
jgi:hypothetical protein